MNVVLVILTALATLCSCFVSCFHAYLDYKRSKDKDPLWDAAINLASRTGEVGSPDSFLQYYEDLLFYREHPELFRKYRTITAARGSLEHTESEPESSI